MRVIFLIIISVSLSLASDVWTDSKTGLTWQDNNASKTTKLVWEEAKNYCTNLNLAGEENWRLPNIKELQSIVNVNSYNPAIKKGFKHVNTLDNYWSSSSFVSHDEGAWIVYFKNGNINANYKTVKFYVRCVRGRQ